MARFFRLTSTRVLALAIALCLGNAQAALTINFNFDLGVNPYEDANDMALSAANQNIFVGAGQFWENAITGYVDGVSRTITIHASSFSQEASNGSVLLGSAGPQRVFNFSEAGQTFTSAFDGAARFNVNDDAIAGGLLDELTIRHEVGHILGIGTLWDFGANSLYVDGSGEYFGANALEAYRAEFDPSATFVPVELNGGIGTANGHWNEGELIPRTVLSGPNQGESLDDALLTGNLSGSGFLSDTTLGSFRDLGFTTIAFQATAVPEPSASFLLVLLGSTILLRRRK